MALDLLIFKIYNNIKNIPSLEIIILAFCIKIFLVNKGLLFVYLSNILFLGGFSIELVIIIQYLINCKEFKDNSPLLYYIFKYFLFGLLLFTLYKLVIICLNFLVWIKTSLLNKWKSFKLSSQYQYYKKFKTPKDPKDPDINFLEQIRNKKEKKKEAFEVKEKISELKEQLLKIQEEKVKENIEVNDSSNPMPSSTSLNNKRNWKGTIQIGEVPKSSVSDQLNNVNYEFNAYDNQDRKFKKIFIDICKGKEKFYPDESKDLFNEYIDVVNILKNNLKSVEKNIKNKK